MTAGLALVIVLALAGVLLWPATHGPFLFDDYYNLQHLGIFGDGFAWTELGRYLHAFVGNPGRPLGALSFLIEDQAWPTDPAPYKRTNVLLHLLVGVLVFVFVRKLARLAGSTRVAPAWIALAVAAIWLVHPMQVASTMLVVQRMNILAAGFTLAGLSCYTGFVVQRRAIPALFCLGAFAIIAFLCKENGVLAIAYAVVLNHTLLAPTLDGAPPMTRRLLFLGTWGPMLMLAAGIALESRGLFASYQMREFTLNERLMTEARVLAEYAARIVVPRLSGQGIFHDDYQVSTGLLSPGSTLPAIAGWIAALVLAIVRRRRNSWLAFGVLWFIAGHLLESTVLPLELYFEHRNYLPMIGIVLAAVALVARAPDRLVHAGSILLVAWLALAAWSTSLNAWAWGSELRLAKVWHAEHPRSPRAIQMLARALESVGRLDEARAVLVDGASARPEGFELVFQLSLFDCIHGLASPDVAERLVTAARRARPSQSVDTAMARLRVLAEGDACGGAFSSGDWQRVADTLLQNLSYGRVGSLAGSLHYQKAMAAEKSRNLDLAMQEYDTAYRYLRDAQIPQRQAVLLISAGLPAEALEYLAISDASRGPWPKRLFYDVREENADIRQFLRQSGQEQDAAQER
ncbi:MAG TPA: hypothetical protein VFS82_00355 [Lysobacter sp.]|nr:hypothetical protein [Lysobacter sp.]